MNILVCVKQVPDTNEITIDRETNTLNREGAARILNPYDGYALEAAARIRDDDPDTSITVITMGPVQAEEVLRDCLAVAADKAYLVTDKALSGSDTFATSYILASAVKYIQDTEGKSFDVIFCGKQAIDGDTAQVGPELAEHLGYPQVTGCLCAEKKGPELIVIQEKTNCRKIIGVTYPCLITFTKPGYDPRYPTLKRRAAARKAKIHHISAADLKWMDISQTGLSGSPTKVIKTFVPEINKEGILIDIDNIGEITQLLYQVISA